MNDKPNQPSEREYAAAKNGFYIHLIAYALVNALLAGINLTRTPDSRWFLWVLGGWGIGIVCHGLGVFLAGRNLKQSGSTE